MEYGAWGPGKWISFAAMRSKPGGRLNPITVLPTVENSGPSLSIRLVNGYGCQAAHHRLSNIGGELRASGCFAKMPPIPIKESNFATMNI